MGPANLDFVPAHPSGMGGIGHAGKDGTVKILSCGQEGQLCVHNPADLTDKITKSMQAEAVACHCLAVNPEQDNFAVGDQGHFVKVFNRRSTPTIENGLLCASTVSKKPSQETWVVDGRMIWYRYTSSLTATLTALPRASASLCVPLHIALVAPTWQLQEMTRASSSSALLKARYQNHFIPSYCQGSLTCCSKSHWLTCAQLSKSPHSASLGFKHATAGLGCSRTCGNIAGR